MELPSFTRAKIMNLTKTCSITASVIFLTQCSSGGRDVQKKSNGEFQADHGPFDSQGNYIESWADNPPKRKYKGSTVRSRRSSSTTKKSAPAKSTSKPSPRPKISPKIRPKTKSTYKPANRSKSKTKSTSNPNKPTPKPKKITPKAKPPVMHTVSKGDTVYGLARKYGANPNSIIKVNRISNGRINVGQRLIIPRK